MAKRFTDTDIWKKQRWFRKLDPIYKLAFCYIKDMCNHAGVWSVDCTDLMEDLGIEEFSLQDFISAVNVEYDKISGRKVHKERLLLVGESNLWITQFVQFQYQGKDGKVSPCVKAVKSALQYLDGIGTLYEGLAKGYLTLSEELPEGFVSIKDKDKDIDSILEDIVLDSKERIVISLLLEKGLLNDEDSETHKKLSIMLIDEMLAVYQKHKPGYMDSTEVDYPALLQIAYAIAKRKKWSRAEVVGERKGDVLASWDKICSYVIGSDKSFYQKLTINGIANPRNFQNIEEEMRVACETGIKKTKAKAGRYDTGIDSQDIYDN
jgi:hypothetical protein